MGSKPSSTAAVHNNSVKRKRSNTQASHHNQFETKKSLQQQQQILNNRRNSKPNSQQQQVNNTMNTKSNKFDSQECERLFSRYADPDEPSMITPDGTRQFFEDLGLSIEDVMIFAIAWKMHTSTMGYITKDEWMTGMKELGTDSIEKLQAKRPEFEKVFHDPEQFNEMYKYAFSYAKNKNQKCMEVETATVLWSMLLGSEFPIVHDFITFLQEKRPVKVINRDQWQSFIDFVSSDVSNYDESSAWPVLFDEFIEWRNTTV